MPDLTQGLTGKLIGDRGDISQRLLDELLLHKRAIIESSNHPLNNIQQIEHSRHRSIINAMVNVLAALVADVRGKRTAPVAALPVVMEATGVSHEPWANAWCDAGARVSVANPDVVRPFATGRGFLHQTDGVDAKARRTVEASRRLGPRRPTSGCCPP